MDNAEAGWYIAIEEPNPTRYLLMAGPYDSREEADLHAEKCKRIAYRIDGYTHFATWGTGLFQTREVGKLNTQMDLRGGSNAEN
jgi:hypothetical protein